MRYLIAISFLLPICCTAQDEHKLLPADGAANDLYSSSVDISSNLAIVGAKSDNLTGSNEGSAYIHQNISGTWTEIQKLTASDAQNDDNFGVAVAISGNVAVVGANKEDDMGIDAGAAYVYRFNGTSWVEEQKLISADIEHGDEFGFDVAVENNVIVVGAYKEDTQGSNSGAAYIFRYNGSSWVQEDKITYSSGSPDDFFGYSVDVNNGKCIIGIYLDDDNGVNSGSAIIYAHSAGVWSQEQKLVASDGITGDAFGFSVAISDTIVAIGAYARDAGSSAQGAIYVFNFDGANWNEQTILTANDGSTDDWMGYAVDLSGPTILSGAFHDDNFGGESGSVYVFRHDGSQWIQELRINASDATMSDEYGKTVAIDGLNLLVGASGNTDNGTASGSAYVYPLCTYAPAQEICVASADTATMQNIVIWNKPLTSLTDSFKILRNGIGIASVGYDQNSGYNDPVNIYGSPHSYEIITKNICGADSDTSAIHTTMHLTSQFNGSDVELSWTAYDGFSYPYFRIWRDTAGNGNYELIFATLTSQTTYTDVNPPGNPSDLNYLIEVEKGSSCNSGSVMLAGSVSNPSYPAQWSIQEVDMDPVKAYPNPTNGNFQLSFGRSVFRQLEVFDAYGRSVFTNQYTTREITLDFSDLPAGIYFIQSTGKTGQSTISVIKQ